MSRTEQDTGTTEPFDPFAPWRSLRDSGMEAWSKMMLDFVNSDAYARASAQWLDTYLSLSQPFTRAVDQAMTQTLSQYKLPSTDDITRLAERLTNIELRIDDLDARLDEVLKLLRSLDRGQDAIKEAAAKAGEAATEARRAAVSTRTEVRAEQEARSQPESSAQKTGDTTPKASRVADAEKAPAAPSKPAEKDEKNKAAHSKARTSGSDRSADSARQEHK